MAELNPTIESLKEGSWREVASINKAFHEGLIDDRGWLIRPEYAPPSRRAEMIRHVQRNVLHPKGRLIVFVGSEERESRRVESDLSSHGLHATGRAEIPHSKDARLLRRLFWIDSVS